MWSPLYDYYEIRKDNNYSESIDTEKLRSMVSGFATQNIGRLLYENKENDPWFSLCLIYTENGNYAISEDTYFEKINLINIITSKNNDSNRDYYLNLLRSISNTLNWEIILEEDEEGNEEIIIL